MMTNGKKLPVVFYSWQSDLPNKSNRGLIEAALEKACKDLSAELKLAIRVDADIQGESGSPDIAATILDKIDEATVVVADVSIIGVAQSAGGGEEARPVPNPNVMYELGYARHSLGSKRVIMVCNTGYGRIEELPFDIRGKGVIGYSFKADQGEKPAGSRNDLAAKLKVAVAAALESDRAKSGQHDVATEQQIREAQLEGAKALRAKLNDRIINASTIKLVTTEPLIVLRVAPSVSLDGAVRVDLAAAKTKVLNELRPLGVNGGWTFDYDVDSIAGIYSQTKDHPEHSIYTRLYETGVIELVVSLFGNELNAVPHRASRALAQVLPMIEKLDLQGRCFVSLDVLRAKGTHVSTKDQMWFPSRTGRVIEKNDLSPPIEPTEQPKPSDAPKILRSAMDWLWRAAGFERCWFYDDQGNLVV